MIMIHQVQLRPTQAPIIPESVWRRLRGVLHYLTVARALKAATAQDVHIIPLHVFNHPATTEAVPSYG